MREPLDHCHDSNLAGAKAKQVISKAKEEAQRQVATTRNILGTHLEQVPSAVMKELPKKGSLERVIRRARQKANFPLPDPTSLDFEVPDEFHDFVVKDTGRDDPNRIIVLADQEMLGSITRHTWYCDGTFDKVPQIYFQLYSVHCKIGNAYPPFLYCLLPDKTEETYERMFELVKELAGGTEPMKILLDYEKAAHNACARVFPNSELSGCFFHLRQAVIRKIQELGLKRRYNEDLEFSELVKCLTSLAFVPPEDVETVFDDLSEAFPEDELSDSLLTYFKSTYIQGAVIRRRQRGPLFPVELWTHYNDAIHGREKTTNACEGWHNSLRSLFLASHPSLWTLLRGLKKDSAIQRLVVANDNVERPDNRRKKYAVLAERLGAKVQSYVTEEDKLKYLRAVAHLS